MSESSPTPRGPERAKLHQVENELWRDPAQVTAQWAGGGDVDPRLLEFKVQGDWWETLAACDVTLLITREYEHLVMALRPPDRVSYMALPHPSGLTVDHARGVVHVASTRNPNQVFELAPVSGMKDRWDMVPPRAEGELVPVRSRFFPGCLYIHDLAMIGTQLHANAVGENAVVCLGDGGRAEPVWWPRCIDTIEGPIFGRNHLQLNSIAAGRTLSDSYFSASTDRVGTLRPGHVKFPVKERGVLFSGATREPVARGLTRPHSARFFENRVWVDNSGYGELGFARDGRFEPIVGLPGWTRGLCFHGTTAFVGTSRVIPRFRQYAPGLDVDTSVCGVHAIDTRTGETLGSLVWPSGNQIFAIDWFPRSRSSGFPWLVARRRPSRTINLFYAFTTETDR
jgi:uncharacterized protein (TIGR03032 family)